MRRFHLHPYRRDDVNCSHIEDVAIPDTSYMSSGGSPSRPGSPGQISFLDEVGVLGYLSFLDETIADCGTSAPT